MSEPARTNPSPTAADAIEDEVQEALAICGGDAIAALRITLIANAFLEAEVDRLSAAVSSGFARGKVRKAPKSKKAEEKETRIGTLLPAAHESGFGTKRTWVGKDERLTDITISSPLSRVCKIELLLAP